jgi:hypothetical protein
MHHRTHMDELTWTELTWTAIIIYCEFTVGDEIGYSRQNIFCSFNVQMS